MRPEQRRARTSAASLATKHAFTFEPCDPDRWWILRVGDPRDHLQEYDPGAEKARQRDTTLFMTKNMTLKYRSVFKKGLKHKRDDPCVSQQRTWKTLRPLGEDRQVTDRWSTRSKACRAHGPNTNLRLENRTINRCENNPVEYSANKRLNLWRNRWN